MRVHEKSEKGGIRKKRRKRFWIKIVILTEILAVVLLSGILYAVVTSERGTKDHVLQVMDRLFSGDQGEAPQGGLGENPESAYLENRTDPDGGDSASSVKTPADLLEEYMNCISAGAYGEMYAMLDAEASGGISEEDFVRRNSAIYEGIEMENMAVEVTETDEEKGLVHYRTSFDTIAGEVGFENEALFLEREGTYRLVWSDSLIFPGMSSGDKVRVRSTKADRGRILDRNDRILAGTGLASSVGMILGKLEEREEAFRKAAQLLEMDQETIEKKLSAGWVKEDSFVPLKLIPRVEEIKLMSPEANEETRKELERHEALLEIPGVKITDQAVRSYPLGEAAAHLVGYVQNVTAQDLEEHPGEGYTAGSVIGRSGIEGLFEKELRGENGYEIVITDEEGKDKRTLAWKGVRHGTDIKLTIDAGLQAMAYETLEGDKSCFVAMDPNTGEVLALVSTPAFDSNDFIMGMSTEKWTSLNEDTNMPLYNRFRQAWCPGSTFKTLTAAIGLETGAIDPAEDFGSHGRRWQKDASWGGYHVTTLHPAVPANLENALLYSDNIYFAKAALQIGAQPLEEALKGIGFGETMPFELGMAVSRFSNAESIETEIQLADSGYGQGQILMNPLHLAALYTAFCNEGNVVRPCLVLGGVEYWIPGAFSQDTAERILNALIKIVNDPGGTGYGLHREDVALAGKTGTAEIKASQSDTSGTELGWMAVFTAGDTEKRPIVIVNMIEDVKGRGGSGYVVKKDREILAYWFDEGGT